VRRFARDVETTITAYRDRASAPARRPVGRGKAVLIDLRKNKALWEDFYDIAVAQEREAEPRESLAAVRKKLLDE
jgi:hypothetical protein